VNGTGLHRRICPENGRQFGARPAARVATRAPGTGTRHGTDRRAAAAQRSTLVGAGSKVGRLRAFMTTLDSSVDRSADGRFGRRAGREIFRPAATAPGHRQAWRQPLRTGHGAAQAL